MDSIDIAIFSLFTTCGAISSTSFGGAYWFDCDDHEQVKLLNKDFEIVKHFSVIQVFSILTFLFSWLGFCISCSFFSGITKSMYYNSFIVSIMMLLFSCTSFAIFSSSKSDGEYTIDISNCSSGPGFSLMVVVFVLSIIIAGLCQYKYNKFT